MAWTFLDDTYRVCPEPSVTGRQKYWISQIERNVRTQDSSRFPDADTSLPALVANANYNGVVAILVPKGAAAPVPLPATAFLFSCGLVGFGFLRGRFFRV